MNGWTMPRVVEAAIAAAISAAVGGVIAWRIDADIVIVPAVFFLVVFLVVLLRNRTSTIHHRSSRAGARTRQEGRTR